MVNMNVIDVGNAGNINGCDKFDYHYHAAGGCERATFTRIAQMLQNENVTLKNRTDVFLRYVKAISEGQRFVPILHRKHLANLC